MVLAISFFTVGCRSLQDIDLLLARRGCVDVHGMDIDLLEGYRSSRILKDSIDLQGFSKISIFKDFQRYRSEASSKISIFKDRQRSIFKDLQRYRSSTSRISVLKRYLSVTINTTFGTFAPLLLSKNFPPAIPLFLKSNY